MVIKINGKSEAVDKIISLSEFILSKGLSPSKIVIEHNSRIVTQEEWQGINLQENDNIEIVSFVGGG